MFFAFSFFSKLFVHILYHPRTASDFETHYFASATPQLSGTHCLLLLGLLIALVLSGLDLKLTYLQKPMQPSAYDSAPDNGAL